MPNKRYKLLDHVAEKLGLELNEDRRYRLDPQQVAQLHNLDFHGIKRLFWDIETSPSVGYFWEPGYGIDIPYKNVLKHWKIICVSYMWEGSDKVHNIMWDENKDDRELVKELVEVLNQADEISGHNIDRFDIKKVRTRAVYHRIPMRAKYRSFDTLKKARGSFAFPSNRLNDIGDYLGLGEKYKHEGFGLWRKCMELEGKELKKAQDEMKLYCNRDVPLQADVFHSIQSYTRNNTHVGTHAGGLKFSCPLTGSENIELIKNEYTSYGTLKRLVRCIDSGYEYEISNSAWRTFVELNANKLLSGANE